ncbi:12916_t:CDS:1 [Funneliformis mosseae]|uniref:12916_t:CDS:1 n=1 Tax=Funneliformis mosseae TaxID=27381 RepID=A0A9N9G8Q2_FUNMO|nr:12916_t:CDS:1 [Funneliformis mosseae]
MSEFIFVPETNPGRPGTTRVPPSLYKRKIQDYPTITLPFPPTITPEELSTCPNKNKVVKSKAPNCFFVYRQAYVRELKNFGRNYSMTEVSGIIASSWRREPKHVKLAYKNLAQDANKMHKKKFGDVQVQPCKKNLKKQKKKQIQNEMKLQLPLSPPLSDNSLPNINDSESNLDWCYLQQTNQTFNEPYITYFIEDDLSREDSLMDYFPYIGQPSKDENVSLFNDSEITEISDLIYCN